MFKGTKFHPGRYDLLVLKITGNMFKVVCERLMLMDYAMLNFN